MRLPKLHCDLDAKKIAQIDDTAPTEMSQRLLPQHSQRRTRKMAVSKPDISGIDAKLESDLEAATKANDVGPRSSVGHGFNRELSKAEEARNAETSGWQKKREFRVQWYDHVMAHQHIHFRKKDVPPVEAGAGGRAQRRRRLRSSVAVLPLRETGRSCGVHEPDDRSLGIFSSSP